MEWLTRKTGIWIMAIGVAIFLLNYFTYTWWEIDIDIFGVMVFVFGLVIAITCGKSMKKSSELLSRRNGVWVCIIAVAVTAILAYSPIPVLNGDVGGISGLIVFALTTLLTKDLISDYKSLMHGIATGPTHDFGKICVPLNILKKSTPLTLNERDILETHTAAGFVLLSYYLQDENNPGAEVARDHHERKNGSGYPCGIHLKDRLVEIIAVCDVYDALISLRPYRPISYDNRTALEEITAMAERNEIGWDVVKSLIAHNRQNKPHYKEVKVSMEKRGTPPPGNVYGATTEQKNNAQE